MRSGRSSITMRWISAVAVLFVLSAAASVWRSNPHVSPATRTIVDLTPAIITGAITQGPPVDTGCSGTPKPADPDLGGQDGVLAIAMNSLSIVDYGPDGVGGTADDVEVALLSAPKDLNFAQPSGSTVGAFGSNSAVPVGTYEAIKGVMDNIFRIRCAVTCAGQTYVTKGGAGSLDPDGLGPTMPGGSAAVESPLDISGGMGPQAFNFPLMPPLQVSSGGSTSHNLEFSASAACQMWDISPALGQPAGTSYKILPNPQEPS